MGSMSAQMAQAAFDLDALMGVERVKDMYSCGKHEKFYQTDAHWNECRKLVCPRCGETSPTSFVAELNHGSVEWRLLCRKQIALLNHAYRCRLILDGEWPHPPQTNCHAGHDHSDRKFGNYFAKGAPMECVQAEFDQTSAWLLATGTPEQFIGLPASRSEVQP